MTGIFDLGGQGGAGALSLVQSGVEDTFVGSYGDDRTGLFRINGSDLSQLTNGLSAVVLSQNQSPCKPHCHRGSAHSASIAFTRPLDAGSPILLGNLGKQYDHAAFSVIGLPPGGSASLINFVWTHPMITEVDDEAQTGQEPVERVALNFEQVKESASGPPTPVALLRR